MLSCESEERNNLIIVLIKNLIDQYMHINLFNSTWSSHEDKQDINKNYNSL